MKHTPTDRLLTLGMALYADKRTMEQRVRGIFARNRSARFARVLSAILCGALFIACFTTACRPRIAGVETLETLAAQTAAPTPTPTQSASGDAEAASTPAARNNPWFLKLLRTDRRARTGIRVYDDDPGGELGRWTFVAAGSARSAPEADAQKATGVLLETANALFGTDYTADQMDATLCRDETGHRPNLWRVCSRDDDERLLGFVRADTMEFLSADCIVTPGDVARTNYEPAAQRVAAVLGGTAGELQFEGGHSGDGVAKQSFYFPLGDGRWVMMNLFGDEALTLEAVGVAPDEACAREGVYWRADLRWEPDVVALTHPRDFRKGAPGPDDMPVSEAYEYYYAFVDAAGTGNLDQTRETLPEPNATFYEDHSGVRENYWHIEGEFLTFDLSAQSRHMRNGKANADLGSKLGLTWSSDDEAYLRATETLFQAVFGPDSVSDVQFNGRHDNYYCTVDPVMADGSGYEIEYYDGRIQQVTFYPARERWMWYYSNWEADYLYTNRETGETFVRE